MAQKLKNKQTLYAVMRHDNDLGRDIICCLTKTIEKAENLCGEYEQGYYDSGGTDKEAYFYVAGQTFYDE